MAVVPERDDAIKTGDDFNHPIRFLDLDTREPVNVSGWTWAPPEFREYDQQNDPVIATGTVQVTTPADPVNGLVIIHLPGAVTETFRTRYKRLGTDLQQLTPTLQTHLTILCDIDPDYTRP